MKEFTQEIELEQGGQSVMRLFQLRKLDEPDYKHLKAQPAHYIIEHMGQGDNGIGYIGYFAKKSNAERVFSGLQKILSDGMPFYKFIDYYDKVWG